MREELQRRIGEAFDSPGGIEGDAELRALVESDPEAAAYARDVARLQRAFRDWPLPTPDDDAFESLATRIEQRLGSAKSSTARSQDVLPRIDDPTLAPQFDDDDDLRDATAGLLGPVASSGEFELEELRASSVPPIVGASAMPPPPPPSARPPAPSKESAKPPPPSASAKAAPSRVPPREIPKLAQASDGDRMSFPNVPHLGAPSLGEVRELPTRSKRGRYGWIAGLAAAAAVGLGVVATANLYDGEPLHAPAGVAESTAPGSAASAEEPATLAPEREQPAEPTAPPATTPASPVAAATPTPAPQIRAEAIAAGGLAEEGVAQDDAVSGRSQYARGGGGGASAADERMDDPLAERGRPRSRPMAPAATGAAPARIASVDPRAEPAPAEPPGARRGVASESGGDETFAPEGAASTSASPGARSAPADDLPAVPERGAVLAAIQAIEPAVRACADAVHGVAHVRIVVAGSGRVTTATVSGQFAGTPVGSCIARAVRTGRFPQFSGDRFELTYPFQL